MDIVRYTTVLLVLLSASFAYAEEEKQLIEVLPGENTEQALLRHGIDLYPPFSQEDIDKSVEAFVKATEFSPVSSLYAKSPLRRKERRKIERYTRGDSYVVILSFKVENKYPSKYHSQNHFVDNQSLEYFEKVCDKIFIDVIGADYSIYSPRLLASFEDEVSIEAEITNESELRELISLPKLRHATHYGNAGIIEER